MVMESSICLAPGRYSNLNSTCVTGMLTLTAFNCTYNEGLYFGGFTCFSWKLHQIPFLLLVRLESAYWNSVLVKAQVKNRSSLL